MIFNENQSHLAKKVKINGISGRKSLTKVSKCPIMVHETMKLNDGDNIL